MDTCKACLAQKLLVMLSVKSIPVGMVCHVCFQTLPRSDLVVATVVVCDLGIAKSGPCPRVAKWACFWVLFVTLVDDAVCQTPLLIGVFPDG